MALIKCPFCGKMVSDTVNDCIHCGKLIRTVMPNEKENTQQSKTPALYSSLSENDRIKLDRQYFNNECPKYDKLLNKTASVASCRNSITMAGGSAALILIIIRLIIVNTNPDIVNNLLFLFVLGLCLVLIVLELLTLIVCGLILFKLNNKRLIAIKRYSEWLEKKNIKFTPTFSVGRHEKFYKKINLKYELY